MSSRWYSVISYVIRLTYCIGHSHLDETSSGHHSGDLRFKCRYVIRMTEGAFISQIARFMGPAWSPPGSCRPQMGPMWAPWTLLSEMSFGWHTAMIPSHPDELSPRAKSFGWFTQNFVMSSGCLWLASYVIHMRYYPALSHPDDLLHQ